MFERRRARKRFAEAPDLRADTPEGTLARVSGVVRVLEMHLRAPTTGRACVAFAVSVFEPSRHEPGGFDRNVPFECVDLVPFAIEHAALGRVVIDSQFADLVMPEHRTDRRDDDVWTEFCDRRGLSPASTGTERPLLVGETVSILGTAARRAKLPGRDAGFRDAPTQLCLVGDFDHPLLILDEEV